MPTKKKADEPELRTEEQTDPGDGVEKTAIPAVADGSETVLTTDGEGERAAIDGAPLVVGDEPRDGAVGAVVVRAVASFHDIETRRDYKPGDIVPWGLARAGLYQARGLVVIEAE